jgi:hypothetical protein
VKEALTKQSVCTWSVEAHVGNNIVEARAVSHLVDPARLPIHGEEAIHRPHQDDAQPMGESKQIDDGEQRPEVNHSASCPFQVSLHGPEAEPVALHPREPQAAVLRRGEGDALVMGRRRQVHHGHGARAEVVPEDPGPPLADEVERVPDEGAAHRVDVVAANPARKPARSTRVGRRLAPRSGLERRVDAGEGPLGVRAHEDDAEGPVRVVLAEQRGVPAPQAPRQRGGGQLDVAAVAGGERVPDGESDRRLRGSRGGGSVEEDAAGAGVERVPAAAGGDGRARGRGADEAGGAGVISAGAWHFVAEEAQHRGGAAVEAAEAAAEGGARDEAAPALADERGADEARGVVLRGAEEDLLHELVR